MSSLDGRRLLPVMKQNIHGVASALHHCHGCTFSNTKTANSSSKLMAFQQLLLNLGLVQAELNRTFVPEGRKERRGESEGARRLTTPPLHN